MTFAREKPSEFNVNGFSCFSVEFCKDTRLRAWLIVPVVVMSAATEMLSCALPFRRWDLYWPWLRHLWPCPSLLYPPDRTRPKFTDATATMLTTRVAGTDMTRNAGRFGERSVARTETRPIANAASPLLDAARGSGRDRRSGQGGSAPPVPAAAAGCRPRNPASLIEPPEMFGSGPR
jgi:hypothetical protein